MHIKSYNRTLAWIQALIAAASMLGNLLWDAGVSQDTITHALLSALFFAIISFEPRKE